MRFDELEDAAEDRHEGKSFKDTYYTSKVTSIVIDEVAENLEHQC